MAIKEGELIIRGQDHKKYWATNFGIKHTKRTVLLDVGNERTIFPDGRIANVSDCSIIMDFFALKTLINLLKYELEQIEKEHGEINLEDEEKFIKEDEEKILKKREALMKKIEPQ